MMRPDQSELMTLMIRYNRLGVLLHDPATAHEIEVIRLAMVEALSEQEKVEWLEDWSRRYRQR